MIDRALHTAWVRAADSTPARVYLFLHGILGSGGNLRGLAQALVQADPSVAALLVDLRLHGKSRALPPPHDLAACARDLIALEAELSEPIAGVVGHSFGGKVALAFHAERPQLERVVLLDSDPSARPDRAGSEETTSVLAMLEHAPRSYARREQFVEYVHARGHSRAIADWLAMNLERTEAGFRLGIDLDGIRALLDAYFTTDLWPVLETSRARIDLAIGGRSRVWDEADRARAFALARERPGRVHVHVFEQAGHWVHVDAAQALRAALFREA